MALTQHTVPGASRNTRQRGEVIALLRETGEFRSAQQLHADLRGRGIKIGLTTVYRTLQALAGHGEVDTMRLPNGEQVYRRCSRVHHHHLTCRCCSRTVEVATRVVEAWTEQVAAEHGYTDVGHTLEIFGTCAECGAEAATRGRAALPPAD